MCVSVGISSNLQVYRNIMRFFNSIAHSLLGFIFSSPVDRQVFPLFGSNSELAGGKLQDPPPIELGK